MNIKEKKKINEYSVTRLCDFLNFDILQNCLDLIEYKIIQRIYIYLLKMVIFIKSTKL